MESKKLYYTMGEVSEMFCVAPSLIRYWEGHFSVIKPVRNKKGNRMFTPADVENFKIIYHLVKERGMTLDGAQRAMKQNRGTVKRDAELLERLQHVRSLLEEVREELKEPAPRSIDCAAKEDSMRTTVEIKQGAKEPKRVAKRVVKKSRKKEGERELFAFYEQKLF